MQTIMGDLESQNVVNANKGSRTVNTDLKIKDILWKLT